MLLKLAACALAFASAAVAVSKPDRSQELPVFTATRAYKTITDVAPYIVTATTTVIWTASPSTVISEPTGPGL
ncbi:hypothetical protein B0H12DRAFT_1150789 [Mycena haematopus]|nr:hypothetical protein B0H12DRAFT_1150789 [Mycena haematopus]